MDSVNVPENNASNTTSSHTINFIYLGALIGIVFLIIIFALNYFNILSLSMLFPNQFGWLSHKEKPVKEFHQKQTSATPTGYIRFSYNTAKAEKTLKDYITSNIKEVFIPSKIEVKQNLISTGELKGTDYKFGANWTSNDTIFNAGLHYIKNTNDLRDVEFYIIPQGVKNAQVDSTNSATLIKTYLKNIPESVSFDCGVSEKTAKFCEHFTVSDAGKNGFGIAEGKDESGNQVLLIFSCFFPKNDSYYNRRTSCMLFREKDPTGL